MSFLHTLIAICSVLVFGLLFASIKFDVDNEFVTFCAPIGFLAAIVNLCLCLAEKRKHPSEKKPFKGFMMVVDYFTLVCFILVICGSLILTGLTGSFLPLITGLTYSLALIAQYVYLEERRKGAPLEKSEKQPTEIHS